MIAIPHVKLCLFTGLLIIFTNCIYGQSRDSLFYILPLEVRLKALEYTKKLDLKQGIKVFAIISNTNDTTQVLISRYGSSSESLTKLISSSNRYIRIDPDVTIPVLLNYDLLFSDLLHSVTREGEEYEAFRHELLMSSGYLIEFRGLYDAAKLISASYFQF